MDLNDFNKKAKNKISSTSNIPIPIIIRGSVQVFSAEIKNGVFKIGFMSSFENQIVELNECKTLNRSLLKIFQSFKVNYQILLSKKNFKFKIQINLLQKGGDILFDLHSFSAKKFFILMNY